MQINTRKTRVRIISGVEGQQNIKYANDEIEQAETIEYLWTNISDNGKIE